MKDRIKHQLEASEKYFQAFMKLEQAINLIGSIRGYIKPLGFSPSNIINELYDIRDAMAERYTKKFDSKKGLKIRVFCPNCNTGHIIVNTQPNHIQGFYTHVIHDEDLYCEDCKNELYEGV